MIKIFHYTTGFHLPFILKSGQLKVSEVERKIGVKPPALWLSRNEIWENTVIKRKRNGKQFTKVELHRHSGLIRFVLEFKKEKLCSWKKYKYKSNTQPEVYGKMEEIGIAVGANPDDWYASFKNIPLKDCLSCEMWNGESWLSINQIKEFTGRAIQGKENP
jgi:hypothetical protein